MTPRFVFHPAAREDLAEVTLWYEHQRAGLGDELGEVVTDAIRRIGAHPASFPIVEVAIRRAVLRRFPYSLLYIVRPTEIEILGVFHHRRDPAIWRGRAAV